MDASCEEIWRFFVLSHLCFLLNAAKIVALLCEGLLVVQEWSLLLWSCSFPTLEWLFSLIIQFSSSQVGGKMTPRLFFLLYWVLPFAIYLCLSTAMAIGICIINQLSSMGHGFDSWSQGWLLAQSRSPMARSNLPVNGTKNYEETLGLELPTFLDWLHLLHISVMFH